MPILTGRELRLWHWRKVLSFRRAGAVYSSMSRAHNRRADWHLKAVQVMNDHPACAGTTAEQDHITFPEPHSRVPKFARGAH